MARFAPLPTDPGPNVLVPPPTRRKHKVADGKVAEFDLVHRDVRELDRGVGVGEGLLPYFCHPKILT